MNRSTSQAQQLEAIVFDAEQSITGKPQQSSPDAHSDHDSSSKESISNYKTDSLWSNVKYGLGMLAIIVIPPLIPGASVRLLIMGYMLLIVSIYTAAAIVAAMKVLRPAKLPKRSKNRMNYGKRQIN